MRPATTLRGLGAASLAAALCALAAPAASLAASADIGYGATLQYTGGAAESNHLEISYDWFYGGRYTLTDTGVSSITLGHAAQYAHCSVMGNQVSCPFGSIYAIDVQLGGGATGYAHSALEHTQVTLKAGAGTDTLSGGTMLIGGSGTDTLTAGTSGARLVAGTGNTTMNGGPQTDTFQGSSGNDTIDARDGVAEQVSCGAGTDTVVADPSDTVAADCESVDLGTPAVTPPSTDVTPPAGQPTGSDPLPVAVATVLPVPAPVAVGGNAVGVNLDCPPAAAGGCEGQVILTLSGGVPVGKVVAARRERTVLGKSRHFHIAPGRKAAVPVRLSRRGARILRVRGRKHKVLKVTATVVTKTASGSTSTSSTIQVRAARRRPTPRKRK